MAKIIQSPVDMDLHEAGVVDGCNALGVTPHGETLVCSYNQILDGMAIAGKLQMKLVLVPQGLLSDPNAWAVVTTEGAAWWCRGIS